jgi:Fe2+ or Zn2+ uptake regulation protein
MSNSSSASRLTKQRKIILEMLRSVKTHPTAEEVYRLVRKQIPNISLGTVYRNLNLLVNEGDALSIVTKAMPCRFDGDISDHYHVKCCFCGRVDDIFLDLKLKELEKITATEYYSIHAYTVEFEGVCNQCQEMITYKELKMPDLIEPQVKILNALNKMTAPAAGKEIATASGVESEVVNAQITKLKKLGFVDSPVRCKYAITAEGKLQLKKK